MEHFLVHDESYDFDKMIVKTINNSLVKQVRQFTFENRMVLILVEHSKPVNFTWVSSNVFQRWHQGSNVTPCMLKDGDIY